jgi:hypothetical protein
MRTTVTIDDRLLARARRTAALRRKSLSAFVEDALRAELARSRNPASEPFRLITFRGSGGRPQVDLDRTSTLLVAEDETSWTAARPRRRKGHDPA